MGRARFGCLHRRTRRRRERSTATACAPGAGVETTDGHVVLGSESGLLEIPPEQVRRLGRLQPGKLFLVDLERGRIVEDEEVKREVSTLKPYREVVRAQLGPVLRPAGVGSG